ncbi:MAG TPA: c-type cytochrome, partial [Acidobacteriota bacterium]
MPHTKHWSGLVGAVLAVATASYAAAGVAVAPGSDTPNPSPYRIAAQAPPLAPELLELGRATYQKQCAACHGAEGRGDGDAAYLLYPKPRDFTAGRYRLVSTWERVPTDQDLFSTISRGMPGSAMPS